MKEKCRTAGAVLFLHRPLPYAQQRREGVGERVCARNSRCQDDEQVAADFQELAVREQTGQGDGTSEPAVRSKRRESSRPRSAAGGLLLTADSCAALVDELALPSTSRSSADCRPHCVAPAWD
jgi:hypothetical protein